MARRAPIDERCPVVAVGAPLGVVAVDVTATNRPNRRFDYKPVVSFFVLAYAFSWAWVIPWAVTGHTVVAGKRWPTHLPATLGPLLAAFAVTAWTTHRRGVSSLAAALGRWRVGWRWW